MIDQEAFSRQVLKNCDISDSHHAGLYSICGLALRLRDLHKWDKGLNPWEESDSSKVLAWIGDKEEIWEELMEKEYAELFIGHHRFDPFDTRDINAMLEPVGLFYGAGYAYSLKPTFFLGVIEKKEKIRGTAVYTLGRELARDLLTIPAFFQDDRILLRKSAAQLFIWDKMLYVNKSGRGALAFALDSCGISDHTPKALQRHLAAIFDIQKDVYIYHELGEIKETDFDHDTWRRIIADFPHTPVELVARTIRDLLADTNEYGTLNQIIKAKQKAALGFFVAFYDGLAKSVFPELRASFKQFIVSKSWPIIEQAAATGHRTAKRYADVIVDIYREGQRKQDKKWTEKEIEKHVLADLGIHQPK